MQPRPDPTWLRPMRFRQAFFFASEDDLRRYREDPTTQSVDALIAQEQLPCTQFTLKLDVAPW